MYKETVEPFNIDADKEFPVRKLRFEYLITYRRKRSNKRRPKEKARRYSRRMRRLIKQYKIQQHDKLYRQWFDNGYRQVKTYMDEQILHELITQYRVDK